MTLDEAIKHCLENEYISRDELLKHLNECKNDPLFDPDMARICFAISIFVENMKAADVQPVDRWISVDDRLPEEVGYYLVIIGNDMLYSIDIAEYSENRWHKHDRVIYWQDLPDYPKTIKGARMDGEDNE